MQTEKPTHVPITESTLSPRRNVTVVVYGAALVVLFLLFLIGDLFVAVAAFVPNQSPSETAFGVWLTLTALGMAGLGLSSATLYRHPEWKLPAVFAVFPGWFGLTRETTTHGERTFSVTWLGITLAVTAAAAAVVVFAHSAFTAPLAFWLAEGALYTIAIIPASAVRMRAFWRPPKAES